MITHGWIWQAIDALAMDLNTTPSGLAHKAGLARSTFAPSKRYDVNGRPHWPSTKIIAQVLNAHHVSFEQFIRLVPEPRTRWVENPPECLWNPTKQETETV